MLQLVVLAAKAVGILLLLCAVFLRTLHGWLKGSSTTPLPPGPKPIPIVGNMFQMSETYQEKMFLSWGHTFGNIVYAKLLNRPMIVTSSFEVAKDLMEKRGAVYSDRPRFVLLNEMLDLDCNVPLLSYGNQFRKTRKWIQDSFSSAVLPTYRSKQRREMNIMLKGILARPTVITSHIARFTEALLLDIAYGHLVTTENDEFVRLGAEGNHAFAGVGAAGSMLVDFFPVLKYYPTWMPGAAFKRRAVRAAKLLRAMHDVPYNTVKSQLISGNQKPSFAAALLDKHLHAGEFNLSRQEEKDIKGSAGTLFAAGTETMASTMKTFVLAMLLYPDVFQEAREEIDRVVGPSRLPEIDDRESLPYLNAVIKEAYRWHAPLPLGLPHYSSQEDVYNGYRIPKGTLVIANVWGISRNENMYPDPESFKPERFLDATREDIVDPKSYIFGFGRRLCPGMEFADTCIFLVLSNIVATMDIRKAKDERGREITPLAEFTSGFGTHPKPFQSVLVPRSQEAVELIKHLDTDEA
ncbi:hypothetical protein EUX98_g3897 [Antrodiella citrinella]|uniref:Cytochrome P450 n=1 Tax=Antrodiella citrinella TaxID=2447956 RepID=A0A4S4MVB6_9APHY|nr:hypothetical protein EUX98_g3897 [Antrodiella citrinella]